MPSMVHVPTVHPSESNPRGSGRARRMSGELRTRSLLGADHIHHDRVRCTDGPPTDVPHRLITRLADESRAFLEGWTSCLVPTRLSFGSEP